MSGRTVGTLISDRYDYAPTQQLITITIEKVNYIYDYNLHKTILLQYKYMITAIMENLLRRGYLIWGREITAFSIDELG